GFTAVSRNTLTSGQSVARNTLRVSPNEMGRITPVHAIDARPSRTAVMGGTRASVAPPSRSFARPTVARNNVSNIGRPQGGLGNPGGFGRPASPLSNARPSMPSGNARPESAAVRPGAPANNNGRGSMMSRSIPQAGDAGRPSVENRPTTNAPRSP